MRPARRVVHLAALASIGTAGACLAQPRAVSAPAYQAILIGAAPVTSLGVVLPVQILRAADIAPITDARVSAVRLVSPAGAVSTLPPPADASAAPGLRLFRADLPTPGAWTLEFTVGEPGRRSATASLAFDVAAPAPAGFAADPLGPAPAALDAAGAAPGAAIAPAGGAPSGVPLSPSAAARSAGYSPEAAPFCATCAAEAPH